MATVDALHPWSRLRQSKHRFSSNEEAAAIAAASSFCRHYPSFPLDSVASFNFQRFFFMELQASGRIALAARI
jgi:hypothetical protein